MDHAFGTPLQHKASLADWPVYILWLWGHSSQDGKEVTHAVVNKSKSVKESEWIFLVNIFKRIESLDWTKIPTQCMNIILFLDCIKMHHFFRTFWLLVRIFWHLFFQTYSSIRLEKVKTCWLAQSCYPQGLRVARSVILMWAAFCSIWHPTAVDMRTIRYSIIFQQPAARWKSVFY